MHRLETIRRKLEHIDIIVSRNDIDYSDHCSDVYSSIKLCHQAMPLLSYEDVDLSTEFLGYTLKAPVMILGMTGGHPDLISVNKGLAKVAERVGVAIGVGSQRAMIESSDPGVFESYRVVREYARSVPVIGNIGANVLKDLSKRDIVRLVESIKADALAIHLNPAQELIQPEGNTFFTSSILSTIEDLMGELGVPIIIKEVGTGLSYDVVRLFGSRGIRYFDVSGSCGTSWILVEKFRTMSELKRIIAERLSSWGIPTPLAVIEARLACPQAFIIASGGVWDGLRAAMNLALSADLVGLAKPIIKELIRNGIESAIKYMMAYIDEIRSVMFLAGARSPRELRRKPVYICGVLRELIESRGISLREFMILRSMV